MVLPQFPFQDSLISFGFLTTSFLFQYTRRFSQVIQTSNQKSLRLLWHWTVLESWDSQALCISWMRWRFFSIFIFLKSVPWPSFFPTFFGFTIWDETCRFRSLDGLRIKKTLQVRHCRTPLQMCDSQKETLERSVWICLQMGSDVTTSWSYLGSKDLWLERCTKVRSIFPTSLY